MDHIRQFSKNLAFGPFVYEHHLLLDNSQRELLENITVRFTGFSTQAQSANSYTAPHDLRFYIDGKEITKALIQELKFILDNYDDQSLLMKQYQTGMNSWIDLAKTMGLAYGRDVKVDEQFRDQILQKDTLSETFTKLGNIKSGNYGYLHPINFLWNTIDLPPLSLLNIINRHNKIRSTKKIDMFSAEKLTISNGPCRLYSSAWKIPKIFGSVQIGVQLFYHNELLDRVVDLEGHLEELEQFISEDLARILDAVDRDGPLSKILRASQATTHQLKTELTIVKNEVSSHQNQVNGLVSTARDLKTSVDGL